MQVQAFVLERSLEGSDGAVVGRFSRPAEVDLYLVVVRPNIQQPPGELAAVVRKKESWRLPLSNQPIQYRDDIVRMQALSHFRGEGLLNSMSTEIAWI